MFTLAILTGIYSYIIFFLGIAEVLYKPVIIGVTVLWFGIVFFIYKPYYVVASWFAATRKKNNIFLILLSCLLFLQILINLIGALGPELAFDALWYHLTIPEIYLIYHKIFHIPSGLFYYSDMPKLAEMLYTAAIAIHSEILAKFIHFLFGILCLIALYKLSGKFFNSFFSLLCIVIFYSNLVVGWESITAYIDLARTFFEIMALWAWVNWFESKQNKWLYISALMIGYAITTKLLALGSLIIFIFLIVIANPAQRSKRYLKWKLPYRLVAPCNNVLVYILIALCIPFPWFLFSYIHNGTPVYPFFTNVYPIQHTIHILNVLQFFQDIFFMFTRSADPVSPVYLACIPLLILSFKSMPDKVRFIFYYSILALFVWYLTPGTGGGRFILPYLPAFSLLCVWCIAYAKKIKLQKVLFVFIILTVISSFVYRGVANAKYIPVITGQKTKEQFLTEHLNFSFGDFYDTDGYFTKHIKPNDKVLLINFHNLYYVNFPFTDDSWKRSAHDFTYIATQHAALPKQYKSWKKIYMNKKTGVNLYKKIY